VTGWQLTLLSGATADPSTWLEQSDLTAATGKKVSIFLDQPHEISFSMNGQHPEAALVEELMSDVVASFDDGTGTGQQRLVRARVGPSSDTGDETSVTCNFRALSYRDVLNRRILYSNVSYGSLYTGGLEAIGWDLITRCMSPDGGNLGITRGTTGGTSAAGAANAAIDLEAGMVIAEQLQKAFDETTGYDWDITADLVFQTYLRPRRVVPPTGTVLAPTFGGRFLLDYGGSVARYERTVDPSEYANAVRVTGGTPQSPPGGYVIPAQTAQAAELTESGAFPNGQLRQGRWDRQYSDADIFSTARALERAQQLVADSQVVTPTYTLTLKPGMWHGPADMWVGDECPVVIQHGRLNVDTVGLVTSLVADIDDNGGDTVTVTVDGLDRRTDYYRKQRLLLADLARIERR
jgi:murein DD-endopeptidase MepM/ murein hydrolase activator NlpD